VNISVHAKTVPARPSSVLSCSHRWRRANERAREYPFIRLWNVEQFLQRASPNPSVCIFEAKFICAGDDKRRRNCLKDETAEPFFIWKRRRGSIISMTIHFSCCAPALGGKIQEIAFLIGNAEAFKICLVLLRSSGKISPLYWIHPRWNLYAIAILSLSLFRNYCECNLKFIQESKELSTHPAFMGAKWSPFLY